ncbi:MAG: hypothetical protein V1829_00045 [bacterium]
MAFTFNFKGSIDSPKDQKQKKMLIIFAILVLITIVILYFGFFRSPSVPTDSLSMADDSMIDDTLDDGFTENINQGTSAQSAIMEIDFDISFLKTSSFKDLEAYIEWPMEINEKGRANPFLPY